jgi:hypothetical protein
MGLVGIFFAVAVPLVAIAAALGLGLSGGFKFPLAWLFTFATAFVASYCFTLVYCQSRFLQSRKIISNPIFIVPIAIGLSLLVGYLTSGFGVLADPSQDRTRGEFLLGDTLVWSIWGSISGYSIGAGTPQWIKMLTRCQFISRQKATCISILIACLSFGLGILIFLS